MKKLIFFVVLFSLHSCLFSSSFMGNFSADYYSFETPVTGDTLFDSEHSQTLLRFSFLTDDFLMKDFSILLSGRYLRDFSDSPADISNLTFYQSYLKYRIKSVDLFLGRVMSVETPFSGFFDGIHIKAFLSRLNFNVSAGLPVYPGFYDNEGRSFKDNSRYDISSYYSISDKLKSGISFTDLKEKGQIITQSFSVSFNGDLDLFYSWIRFTYSIKPENNFDIDLGLNGRILKKLNYSISYQHNEIQKPPPASLLSLAEHLGLEDLDWYDYKLDRISLSFDYMFNDFIGFNFSSTFNSFKDNNEKWFDMGLVIPWGIVGYRLDTGDTGNKSGPFGSLKYNIFRNLTLDLNSHFIEISYDETNGSQNYLLTNLGLNYQFTKYFTSRINFEHIKPGDKDGETRIIAGLNYKFWRSLK